MPATYAHWRFGCDCIEKMPKKLQLKVHAHRDIFNLAVQGPDFFFFDILHTGMPKHGNIIHQKSARDFFERAKIEYHKYNKQDEMLVYMLGFLTHFALDSVCHSYIQRKCEASKVEHSTIESEWDRHLVELDKRQINMVDRSESLNPTPNNTKIVSRFFKLAPDKIYNAWVSQKRIIKLLNCQNETKYNLLHGALMKLNQPFTANIIMPLKEIRECKDSDLRLDKLKRKALKKYPTLLKNLIDFLNDKKHLIKYFDKNFEFEDDYNNIKVLTYEDEINYLIK